MQLSKIEFIADWAARMGELTPLTTDTALEYVNLRAQAYARPVAWLHRQGDHTEVSDRQLDESEMSRGWTQQPLYTHPAEASAPGLSDEQREGIQECIDYLSPAAKDFAELGMGDSKHARCIRALRALTRASAATVAEPSEEAASYKRMFEDAVRSLAAIDEALGIDPDEAGGAAPILEAIKQLKAAQQQPEPGANERAAFLNKMDALDLKEFRELTGCHSPADYRIKLEDLRGGEESLATEYLQDKVFEDMRLMYKAMGEFDNKAVDRFAKAMKRKMAASRKKGRRGWDDPAQCSPERLAQMLIDHLAKGDPVDVGNFAMMLFNRPDAAGALARAAQSGQRAASTSDDLWNEKLILKIVEELNIMFASARCEVDESDGITGYRVKTGALHRIVGALAGIGQSVSIPANMPVVGQRAGVAKSEIDARLRAAGLGALLSEVYARASGLLEEDQCERIEQALIDHERAIAAAPTQQQETK